MFSCPLTHPPVRPAGHLNNQIEHHLMPTMPRHNYGKVKPLVEKMCKNHDIEYQSKTLLGAMADIVVSLSASGELWWEAYHLDDKRPAEAHRPSPPADEVARSADQWGTFSKEE